MITKDEADAIVGRINIILPCVGALILASGILMFSGAAGPSKPFHHNALLAAITFTAIGLLLVFMKMCKRMEEYDRENGG